MDIGARYGDASGTCPPASRATGALLSTTQSVNVLILLLAKNPHGGEHLRDLLAGQILWVRYAQLAIPLAVTVFTLALLWTLRGRLPQLGFYLVFALAVTVSVQLVGVYLVFATLIAPSLGARSYPPRRRTALAYAIAVLGYALGLVLSAVLDLPSGALIVWCLAALAIGAQAVAPRCMRRAGTPVSNRRGATI